MVESPRRHRRVKLNNPPWNPEKMYKIRMRSNGKPHWTDYVQNLAVG
jgi:hypothetical protein